ncbi:hypothetical protein F1654_00275 [Alkalicaulis satelles]|uniref:Uncharacterized protein n=2 Tax=Alkalicaulis satelles TaxID=2609175 RepID=A0A5M6ZQD7_9PROT|nr:hypothetical protein F1654_00275 [Alkalicaulis satelles]
MPPPDALRSANIHPETGLATDYLNHFNEVVMLLEMLPDMPDCAEDVLAWAPCGYEDHFERTGYSGRETVIEAWRAAPRAVRAHFETLITVLDDVIISLQAQVAAGDLAGAALAARSEAEPLLAAARAAVHGHVTGESDPDQDAAQASVDALFG